MNEVMVHPHALKHGLREDEILFAWENFLVRQNRASPREDEVVCIGITRDGHDVQMIGVIGQMGTLIVHAMHPVTEKVRREVGIRNDRGRGGKR